jgi:hypothetical protein
MSGKAIDGDTDERQLSPLRLLVDNSISSHAEIAHGTYETIPGSTNRLFLVKMKPAKGDAWLRNQLECLPTIARLAREGIVRLHRTDEIDLEGWQRRGSYPYQAYGDIFRGVAFERVPPAVTRRALFQQESNRKGARIEFCQWLVKDYSKEWLDAPSAAKLLTPNDLHNLANVARFRAICRHLTENLYDDAFHMWTGETAGLSRFLTMDKTFANHIRTRGLDLPCFPIFPEELLSELDISKRDPMPYEYGRRYLLSGRPYD